MGDRVAIIGGGTVGRDHFPYAVIDDTIVPVPSDFYQQSVALGHLAKWFWLVRAWHLNGTIEWIDNDIGYSIEFTDTLIDRYVLEGEDYVVASREAQLVVESQLFINTGISASYSDPGLSFEAFGVGLLDNIDPGGFPGIQWDGGFYPEIGFSALIASIGDNLEITSDADGAIGELVVDGTTTTNLGASGGPLIDPDSVEANLALTPASYWPYANSNGDPVYDTSDGSELTDPLG